MRRAAVLLAAVFALPAAADPPKPGGVVQMLVAKIDGDKLVSSTSAQSPRTVNATDKDGNPKTIQVMETVTITTARELKLLKATDADGKEVSASDLKARLKDGGLVVFLDGPLPAEWRKRFKSSVLFVEYDALKDDEKK
jgi:hypothetical protein